MAVLWTVYILAIYGFLYFALLLLIIFAFISYIVVILLWGD